MLTGPPVGGTQNVKNSEQQRPQPGTILRNMRQGCVYMNGLSNRHWCILIYNKSVMAAKFIAGIEYDHLQDSMLFVPHYTWKFLLIPKMEPTKKKSHIKWSCCTIISFLIIKISGAPHALGCNLYGIALCFYACSNNSLLFNFFKFK